MSVLFSLSAALMHASLLFLFLGAPGTETTKQQKNAMDDVRSKTCRRQRGSSSQLSVRRHIRTHKHSTEIFHVGEFLKLERNRILVLERWMPFQTNKDQIIKDKSESGERAPGSKSDKITRRHQVQQRNGAA